MERKLKFDRITVFALLGWLLLGGTITYFVYASLPQNKAPKVTANVFIFHESVKGTDRIGSGNLITDIGEQYVRNILGFDNVTANNATHWISVSNDASPLVSWTKLPNEVNANNFTRRLGTVIAWVNSGDYAYNVSTTFTATGTQQLQAAGSNWNDVAESDNNLFAAAAFTQTTFNSNDNCTIVWVFTVNAN